MLFLSTVSIAKNALDQNSQKKSDDLERAYLERKKCSLLEIS
jgi:hypothetical protein